MTLEQAFASQVAAYQSGDSYYGPSRDVGSEFDTRSYVGVPDRLLKRFAEDAYKPSKNLAGFTYSPGLSTGETSVYVNARSKQAVIALRGTIPSHPGDLYADTFLAAGRLAESARYRRAQSDIRSALDSLGGYHTSLTGHSLGGSLVNEFTADFRSPKLNAVAFNPGYAVPGRSQTRGNKSDRQYVEYLNRYDIVSAGSYFRSKKQYTRYYSNGRYAFGAHRARPTDNVYRYQPY